MKLLITCSEFRSGVEKKSALQRTKVLNDHLVICSTITLVDNLGVLNVGTIDGREVTDIPSYTKMGHDMVSFFTV